jgi:hypothetical protein
MIQGPRWGLLVKKNEIKQKFRATVPYTGHSVYLCSVRHICSTADGQYCTCAEILADVGAAAAIRGRES